MKVVSNLLKTGRGRVLVRLVYLIPGCIFLYLIIESHEYWYWNATLNIQLFVFFGIPAAIFLYQGIRNSLFGWWLVLVLYMIYGLIMVQDFTNWNSLLGAKNDVSDIPYWVLLFIIYLLVGVFLFIIRPRKPYV